MAYVTGLICSLVTLVNGIIFEPTNYDSVSSVEQEEGEEHEYEVEHTYLDDLSPSTLPEYLSDFATHGTTIEEGPPVEQCIGVGDRKHCFLVNSGSRLCIGY